MIVIYCGKILGFINYIQIFINDNMHKIVYVTDDLGYKCIFLMHTTYIGSIWKSINDYGNWNCIKIF